MKVEDFYRELLAVLNVEVTDDGYLYTETPDGDSSYIEEDGIPYRLPVEGYTKEQMQKMDDGTLRPRFYLYNPLVENQLDLNQGDIELTTHLVGRQLTGGLYPAFIAAGKVASGEEGLEQVNTTKMQLVDALGSYTANHTHVSLGDKKWVALIKRLANEYYKDADMSMVTIVAKPGTKNYTAVCETYCNMLDAIEEDTDGRIFGTTWRVKDKELAKIVLNTLFPTNPVVTKTRKKLAGVMASIMSAYITIGDHINGLLGDSTSNLALDVEAVKKLRGKISSMEAEIKMFPPPTPRKKAVKQKRKPIPAPINPPGHTAPPPQPPQEQPCAPPPAPSDSNDMGEDDLQRLFGPAPVVPQQPVQQVPYSQPAMPPQPQWGQQPPPPPQQQWGQQAYPQQGYPPPQQPPPQQWGQQPVQQQWPPQQAPQQQWGAPPQPNVQYPPVGQPPVGFPFKV